MKSLLLLLVATFYQMLLFAQDRNIDSNVLGKWTTITNGAVGISDNGKYSYYVISNYPVGNKTLVLQSLNSSWEKRFIGVSDLTFTDSQTAIFITPGDSLFIVSLGKENIVKIANVNSYKVTGNKENEWLAYLHVFKKELVVKNLVTGIKHVYENVTDYQFDKTSQILILNVQYDSITQSSAELKCLSLATGCLTSIFKGLSTTSWTFDKHGSQFAFVVDSNSVYSIWHYKIGSSKAHRLVDKESLGINETLQIYNIEGFSNDGKDIFFQLQEEQVIPKGDAVQVDVWSYMDGRLQSSQLKNKNNNIYLTAFDIEKKSIVQLQLKNDVFDYRSNYSNSIGNYLLIQHLDKDGDRGEYNWNPIFENANLYLLSIKDGKRELLKWKDRSFQHTILSPSERYLIYFDQEKKNYFSYDISTGKIHNITYGIDAKWNKETNIINDTSSVFFDPIGIACWTPNDKSVLIYDRFDIWQLDPAGLTPPVNLTKEYGRLHNIVFRLAIKDYDNGIINKQKIVLSAFNKTNKDNGFYSIVIGENKDPQLLTMGQYVYNIPFNLDEVSGFYPIKARKSEIYIVRRESATTSPNYFSTNDFKKFKPLSKIYPEKDYNWLTTKLYVWKTNDSSYSEGILYKPQDFDSTKKYPIIFNYYEQMSDGLNQYIQAEASRGNINIPWFVSNGYLVFTPDIHYKIGETGESILNSVISAANYLSKENWVDSKRMGIQGHSFGGYETGFIVTHSNIFAAACASNGYYNCVSDYGTVMLESVGWSRAGGYETGHQAFRSTPWERPDIFIKNSSLFYADKVSTPLLLMGNKGDGQVSFSQSIEFFTALRRLGKKAWMLQYDGEDHLLWNDRATRDFTMRMTQFFDHYLKDYPAPKWMQFGISASKKGIESGFDFDTINK